MRLRHIREDKDLMQKGLADYLNIRQSTYSQYESEQQQIPIAAFICLAEYFHTSVNFLLRLTNKVKPYPRTKSNGQRNT